jgi:hypothetical protein
MMAEGLAERSDICGVSNTAPENIQKRFFVYFLRKKRGLARKNSFVLGCFSDKRWLNE